MLSEQLVEREQAHVVLTQQLANEKDAKSKCRGRQGRARQRHAARDKEISEITSLQSAISALDTNLAKVESNVVLAQKKLSVS